MIKQELLVKNLLFITLSIFIINSKVNPVNADYKKVQVLQYGQQLKDNLYQIADDPNLSKEKKLTQMTNFVMKKMNILKIGKRVIGSYYKELSLEEREEYHKKFEGFLFNNLRESMRDTLLVPGKNVKLIKSVNEVSDNYYDITFNISESKETFPFTVSVYSQDLKNFMILNFSVSGIDVVENQHMIFRSAIEESGLKSIFSLLDER